MRVTNRDINNFLSSNIITILNKGFTTKTSYWIARLVKRLEIEAKVFFTERQRLIEKYAARYDADGQQVRGGKVVREWKRGEIINTDGNIKLIDVGAFNREVDELLDIEVEVPGLEPITYDFNLEPTLTPAEIITLMPFIEIKEE